MSFLSAMVVGCLLSVGAFAASEQPAVYSLAILNGVDPEVAPPALASKIQLELETGLASLGEDWVVIPAAKVSTQAVDPTELTVARAVSIGQRLGADVVVFATVRHLSISMSPGSDEMDQRGTSLERALEMPYLAEVLVVHVHDTNFHSVQSRVGSAAKLEDGLGDMVEDARSAAIRLIDCRRAIDEESVYGVRPNRPGFLTESMTLASPAREGGADAPRDFDQVAREALAGRRTSVASPDEEVLGGFLRVIGSVHRAGLSKYHTQLAEFDAVVDAAYGGNVYAASPMSGQMIGGRIEFGRLISDDAAIVVGAGWEGRDEGAITWVDGVKGAIRLSVVSLELGGLWWVLPADSGPFQPYVLAGAGFFHATWKYDDSRIIFQNAETGAQFVNPEAGGPAFGVRAGGGVSVGVADQVSLDVEGGYVWSHVGKLVVSSATSTTGSSQTVSEMVLQVNGRNWEVDLSGLFARIVVRLSIF